MKRERHIGVAVVAGLLFTHGLAAAGPPSADPDTASTDELRAAYILNFARFINWPGERAENNAPLVIGVWADPAMAAVLSRVVNGQTVRGRPLAVRSLKEMTQAAEVNILYVGSATQKPASRWLAEYAGSAILTISDNPEFCKMGGMITLYWEGRRIRFEINQESLQRSGLHASSKLLALSKPSGGVL